MILIFLLFEDYNLISKPLFFLKAHQFDKISDYFIKVGDAYYLVELINAVGDSLNIDDIINKVNEPHMIKYLIEHRSLIESYFSEEQLNRLLDKK